MAAAGSFPFEKLIELVRPHKFLFDKSSPGFKDTIMKENRWAQIGHTLGVTGKLNKTLLSAVLPCGLIRCCVRVATAQHIVEIVIKKDLNAQE